MAWVLARYFNSLLHPSDKKDKNPNISDGIEDFEHFVTENGLMNVDLGGGVKYT